jgi:hypothetical protein
MDELSLINNTSVYRNPAPQSPLQGLGVMQPPAVYSKIMLRTAELAEADFVFDNIAVERTMPSNNGSNEIIFKRMLSLAAHTQPLVEGIPPASDQGRMVAIKATTNSYGRVMKFTDKVSWAVVDPLISEYTRQLSLKIPETKDLLAQEALLAECQMFYAAPKKSVGEDKDILAPIDGKAVTHIKFMTPDCAPTIDEFRKIVLSMEAAKVRPYQGSNFLVLASSAVLFDLITDKRVKEFMKWEGTGKAYTNDMVIDLFSLAFKKAKTIKTDNTYTDGDGNICYIYHDAANSKNYIFVGADITSNSADVKVIEVTLSDNGTKELNASTVVKTNLEPLNIHHSFVLGEECLFRVGVEGHTQAQFITKPLGSAGTEDPLNQRQSIGWKIDSLGYKVANPDAVVDYVSCPTQYKINVNARPDFKNQFTDYQYGYMDANNRYFHPEQVFQSIGTDGNVHYYVKGTNTEVHSVRMTDLVKPVNGGRLMNDGQNARVVGMTPTAKYALATDHSIRFTEDQVEAKGDGTYHIKGVASAVVVKLPQTFTNVVKDSEGNTIDSYTAIDFGVSPANLTGDPTIDNK